MPGSLYSYEINNAPRQEKKSLQRNRTGFQNVDFTEKTRRLPN